MSPSEADESWPGTMPDYTIPSNAESEPSSDAPMGGQQLPDDQVAPADRSTYGNGVIRLEVAQSPVLRAPTSDAASDAVAADRAGSGALKELESGWSGDSLPSMSLGFSGAQPCP